jgi:hypothetical protein
MHIPHQIFSSSLASEHVIFNYHTSVYWIYFKTHFYALTSNLRLFLQNYGLLSRLSPPPNYISTFCVSPVEHIQQFVPSPFNTPHNQMTYLQ